MTEQRSPEPGWYPDPSGSRNLRWWNGLSWSDATHPLPGASTTSVPAPSYPSIFGDDPAASPPQSRRRAGGCAVAMVVLLLLVAGLAVAVLVGAVSNRSLLDTAVVEQRIAEDLSRSTGLTTTVVCPDDVTISSGDTFQCTATTDDGTLSDIEVTQLDDQGNVSWVPSG